MRPLLVRPLVGTGVVTANLSLPLPVTKVVHRKEKNKPCHMREGGLCLASFGFMSCPRIRKPLCIALHYLLHLLALSSSYLAMV